jgi:hypothetical protein
MGLAAAPYFGGLIVAMGIALTRLSGRLNATVTPRRTVAAERYCNPAAHCRG